MRGSARLAVSGNDAVLTVEGSIQGLNP